MFRENVIYGLIGLMMAGLMGMLPTSQANAQLKAPPATIATFTKDRLQQKPARVSTSTLMAPDAKQAPALSASALRSLTPSSRAPAPPTSFSQADKLELLKTGGAEGTPESGSETQTVTRLTAAKWVDGQISLSALRPFFVGTQGVFLVSTTEDPLLLTSELLYLKFRDMDAPNRYLVEFSVTGPDNNEMSVMLHRKNTQYDQSTEGWEMMASSSHQVSGSQSLAIIVDTTVNGWYIVTINPTNFIRFDWVELTKLE